jgi:hypothetical protein
LVSGLRRPDEWGAAQDLKGALTVGHSQHRTSGGKAVWASVSNDDMTSLVTRGLLSRFLIKRKEFKIALRAMNGRLNDVSYVES